VKSEYGISRIGTVFPLKKNTTKIPAITRKKPKATPLGLPVCLGPPGSLLFKLFNQPSGY
jgi:hypothetical protein